MVNLSGAQCRLAYGPADATATALTSRASVKSRLVLPFWYRLTRVIPGKGPSRQTRARACVRVCVCVCVRLSAIARDEHRDDDDDDQ